VQAEEQYNARQYKKHATWDFHLDPGDKVLVRQYTPGKNLPKAVGPWVYLGDIGRGGSGAEVLNTKGKVIKVAKANLRPYFAPAGATKCSRGLGDQESATGSDSDWSIYDEDWD
jgi:hypothetical protein